MSDGNKFSVAKVMAPIADVLTSNLPIITTFFNAADQTASAYEVFKRRKVAAALTEISHLNPVLLGQTFENLKSEWGQEYVEDTFFDSIQKANSAEMARLTGKFLNGYCLRKITMDQYFMLLDSTRVLTLRDVRALESSQTKHVSDLKSDIQNRLEASGLSNRKSGYGQLVSEWNVDLLNAFIVCLDSRENVKHKVRDTKANPSSIDELPNASSN